MGSAGISYFFIAEVLCLLSVGICLVLLAYAMVRDRQQREKQHLVDEDAPFPMNEWELSDQKKARLVGMTLNERLAAFDVQADWDRALAARDRAAMILTLRRVLLSEHDAQRTADSVLRDPGKHGF